MPKKLRISKKERKYWNTPKCQEYYKKFLEKFGEEEPTYSEKLEAKRHAIHYVLTGEQPDYNKVIPYTQLVKVEDLEKPNKPIINTNTNTDTGLEISLTIDDIINFLENHENINQLPTIDEIFDYFTNDWDVAEFQEVLFDNVYEGISFTLKDGTGCELTYCAYKCIKHSYRDDEGLYIYSINDCNLYVCASCHTLLQPRPDILGQYEYINETDNLLIPKKWTDNGIHAWCKRRQQKQKEYYELSRMREKERMYINCYDCIHLEDGECEYDLDNYYGLCNKYELREIVE